MLTLAENVIVAGAHNHPSKLDMTLYSSWASRMLLYIKGKENGKLLNDLVLNGPFKYRTVIEPKTLTTPITVRDRRYDELTDAKKIHKACDIKATNTVLQHLPQDIYNLVHHHDEAKHIWDRVNLLIEGSEISLQEKESKLSNYTGTGVHINGGTTIAGQAKVIRCYNFQEEGHMTRQCTKPKRPRNPIWFKGNAMLVEALELGVVLDEAHMAFLADNGDTVRNREKTRFGSTDIASSPILTVLVSLILTVLVPLILPMTSLAEFMIVTGGDNRPHTLDKTMYDSWQSNMELYIEGKDNGRMMLNSDNNGPLIWPNTVNEDGTTRVKKYEELTATEKLQADCDLKTANIVLQGLPPDVYSLVNHHKVAKDI
ncbi:hypothetical protein Tco_1155157 [Tanacetum coccineum]